MHCLTLFLFAIVLSSLQTCEAVSSKISERIGAIFGPIRARTQSFTGSQKESIIGSARRCTCAICDQAQVSAGLHTGALSIVAQRFGSIRLILSSSHPISLFLPRSASLNLEPTDEHFGCKYELASYVCHKHMHTVFASNQSDAIVLLARHRRDYLRESKCDDDDDGSDQKCTRRLRHNPNRTIN